MITITTSKNKYGSQFALADGIVLFQFEYRKEETKWYFWLRGEFNPDIFDGEKFPYAFFIKAVYAKAFIKFGKDFTGITGLDEATQRIKK